LFLTGLSHLSAQDTIFNYNPLWTKFYFLDDSDRPYHLATTIAFLNRFHPAEQLFGYRHIGQLGAPAEPMFLSKDNSSGLDIGFHQLDQYWLSTNSIKLYDTYRPYTLAAYQQGSKNEIAASLIHAQNIIPEWNAGIELHRYRTDGFYPRQVSKITNFNAYTSYGSKNGLYHIDAGYLLNSMKVNENGGVEDVEILKDSSIFDKSLVTVQLDSAMNYWKNDNVFLQNSIDFGPSMEIKKNDTLTQHMIVSKVRVQHFAEWERRSFIFYDDATDSNFYQNIYIDSLKTRDSLSYDRLSNEITIGLPLSSKPLIRNFTGKIFFHHDLYKIHLALPDQEIQNGILGGSMIKYIGLDSVAGPKLTLNLKGEYNLLSYNKGDYNVSAAIAFRISSFGNILLEASKSENHPALIQQNYLSNHFQWYNSFSPFKTASFRGSFAMEPYNMELGGELFRIDNFIYWNSLALPAQYDGSLVGYSIFLRKNFSIKSFHLDNEIQYQHYNVDSIVSFPPFFTRHSLYFEDNLFKGALTSKVGIDVRYIADHYGPAYMPATGQFYIQRLEQLSYYPVADLFISIKIKGVRAFAMVQNINQDLFARVNFSAYRYPMPDRAFKLGVEWRFWN
jgi:hypothetical protein